MVSVNEASQIIQSIRLSPIAGSIPIEEIAGRVLAETIVTDRDLPPFDRVAMDGIAIASKEFRLNQKFLIERTHPAGAPNVTLQQDDGCIEVMTGAVLPEGTDTVVRYEDVLIQDGWATIKLDAVHAGMNIHKQASDAQHGEILLTPGTMLTSAEAALLASVGKLKVRVYEFPRTIIVSSGDELVDIPTTPEPHQIRRSNSYALLAAMFEIGWRAEINHLNDNKELITVKLREWLSAYDVLILTGGVSKGKFDFIPEVLADLGVEKLFHQVKQKPGKPFWFGQSPGGKVVFALPGNPVSTFLCFYRYIKPWIMSNLNVSFVQSQAVLSADVEFKADITYFLQVKVAQNNGTLIATPVSGGGSGDFVNLVKANGFLELPEGQTRFLAGEVYDYYSFRQA
ncbi:MAG: molybdopterin molybdotransferase MoeA [Cyclobacteriaceae bacterium]|nr:molybdopterin molybdotransferase MoeA [Cyclobacteriaceae bacterium]